MLRRGKGRHYRNGKNERVRREGVKKEKRERAEREQLDDCTGGRKKKKNKAKWILSELRAVGTTKSRRTTRGGRRVPEEGRGGRSADPRRTGTKAER